MNDKAITPALARRLAAYSATVGVALAVAPTASGQIVYHDYEPNIGGGLLDFDDDGVEDLLLTGTDIYGCHRGYTIRASFRVPAGGNALNGLYGYDGPYDPDPNVGALVRFGAGDVIGPASPPNGFYRTGALSRYLYCTGGDTVYPFADRGGFAGFRFVAGDGALHYGWMRITEPGDDRVDGYGYESAPETPIVAGRKTVFTDGSVNQTAFPPEGGTLVYSFTLANNTDAPLPLDLWVDAELNGTDAFTRRLGSGTLPAGATVARTVSLPVPARAPFGTYDVKFKVGDFDTQVFLTFEAFAIAKTGAAERAPGSETTNLFAVAPLPGDLFAEVASTVGLPGTHVFSEAAPNPSTGRTAFTLEVAEPQAVRVAVYNALGQQVTLVHDGVLAAGAPHRLVLEAGALATGVYVLRAVGATFADSRTFTLTR